MLLTLAPMQDITDLAFLRALHLLGIRDIDYFTTPYFRALSHSEFLDPELLEMIEKQSMGKPIYAQLIGSDPEALCCLARKLHHYPIAGIDLNLGCPAPIVCRKNAGGAALKDTARLDTLIGKLRDAVSLELTVKTRLGYEHPDEFEDILHTFKKHAIDRLTIHARTVKEGYRTSVHTEYVARALEILPCPIIANGNIVDTQTARGWVSRTHPHGLMIGRGAVRNPWIFRQIRNELNNIEPELLSRKMIYTYTQALFECTMDIKPPYVEKTHIHALKKFLIYVAQGLEPEFEFRIRRARTADEYHDVCRYFLDRDEPYPLLPPSVPKLLSHFGDLIEH